MARPRVRIEFDDGEGGRFTFTLGGAVSRQKVLKLLDMVEVLSGNLAVQTKPARAATTMGKLFELVDKHFPLGSFTSTDLLEAYEDEYRLPIRLSAISTYLSRLSERGSLRRERSSGGWTYRRTRLGDTG